jgi:hypothetical protein
VGATAADRTRALLEQHLGVGLGVDSGDAYRDARGKLLDGEWLGAFAQPGVITNTVTAVSATLSASGGRMVDEYGASDVAILSIRDGRVEMRKAYSEALNKQFVYVGRLGDGTFAGYWYSRALPWFRGGFHFTRADRMPAEARDRLRVHVRSWSWRKVVALALVVAMPIVLVASGFDLVWWADGAVIALMVASVSRVWAFGRLADRARAELAQPARSSSAGSSANQTSS